MIQNNMNSILLEKNDITDLYNAKVSRPSRVERNDTGLIEAAIAGAVTNLIGGIAGSLIQKEIAEDQLKLQKRIADQQFQLNKSITDAQVKLVNAQTVNTQELGKIEIKIAGSNSEVIELENELRKEILVGELDKKKAENAIAKQQLSVQQENFGLPTENQLISSPPVIKSSNKTIFIVGGGLAAIGLGYFLMKGKSNA